MPDSHFLSAAVPPAGHTDVFGPLHGGERVLWQGRCAVAEYAFDKAASLPRWALPETTEILVTDQRVLYAYTRSDSPDDLEVTSGELRWLWPQHLRVQPGARTTGRAAAAAQLQLVCAASDGSFPALVLAGGDLDTVADADRLANLIRHAIARFRVDNADKLGLSTPQARMLSRLLIGPEFSNYQGGEGQTVTLLGALPVHRPADPEPVPDLEIAIPHAGHAAVAGNTPAPGPAAAPTPHTTPAGQAPAPTAHTTLIGPVAGLGHDSLLLASLHPELPQAGDSPSGPLPPYRREAETAVPSGTTRLPGHRPGRAADEARALQAAAAEQATHLAQPELASRAADLPARVASLVSAAEERAAQDQAARDQLAQEQAAREQAAPVRAAQDQVPREQAAWEQAAPEPAAEEEADLSDVPTTDLTARAAHVRRAAARFAANAAKGKAGARRAEPEIGSTSRGNRNR